MKHFNKGYILSLFFILPVTFLHGQSSEMIKIEKLPFNSRQYSEIAAVIVPDGILFCSDRRVSGVVNNKTFDGDRVYSMFFAEREDTMKWGNAKIYSRDLQSLFTQGPFCFSPDRRQLYYTSDIERGSNAFNSDFDNRSGIFIAERTAGGWSAPRAFEYNDPLWNVGHPCISGDGRYLFFSSDMPGGYGGSDLYMCRREDDKWSEPENLGDEINSSYSELYPYYGPDGVLYFASDRDGGYGGLDLYRSTINNESWSQPALLPQPINSIADDFSLFKERYGESGFFASNRDRSDDIYMYTSLLIRKSECNELVYDNFCWEFIEENSMKFDSIPFEYEWDFGDGTTLESELARAEHCFEEPGTYLVKLNVIDMITGEIQYNETSYLLEIEQTEQAFISVPDTCYAGETISLDASKTYLPGWDISEYYWNFDDGTGGRGMNINKTYSVEGIFNVQLIVSSYPDDEGNISETCVAKNIVVRGR
ncbi:MAG: PKD domain-containing protein [Bacteroidales bacterium]|nr:PKD domain-containing protein [Bacteroidales bacterium]